MWVLGTLDFFVLGTHIEADRHHPRFLLSHGMSGGFQSMIACPNVPKRSRATLHKQMGAMRAAYTTAGSAVATAPLGPGCDGGAGSGPDTAGGVAAGTASICLENLTPDQVPVDWSIKRSLTFSSHAPFTVHERAQQAPARASECC